MVIVLIGFDLIVRFTIVTIMMVTLIATRTSRRWEARIDRTDATTSTRSFDVSINHVD